MLLLPTGAARRRARTPLLRTPILPALTPAATGRVIVVVAFLAASVGGVLAKTAFAHGATPESFLLVRLLTAVALLAVIGRRALLAPGARRIGRMLLLGVGFGAQTLAYHHAVDLSPVALVIVVVSTYPIAVIAMDAVADRTAPPAATTVAAAVALVGLWLAAGSPVGAPDAGVVLALVSAVGYAAYLRISARTMQASPDGTVAAVPPVVATAWVLTGALALMGALAVVTAPALPDPAGLAAGAAHGVVSTCIPIVAVYAALQRLTPGQIACMGPLEPVVASAVAVGVLGEVLTAAQVAGIALVLLAVARMAGVRAPGLRARPRIGLPRLPLALPRHARQQ